MKKILLFALLAAGCGSAYTAPAPTTPGTQDAIVSGQYSLLLTSSSGHGTTNVYTNFTQSGKTFAGGVKTLVCPSNDLSQCQGDDAQVVSITASGTVSGDNVTMKIFFPTMAGPDTVTMVGTAAASGANLAGTYTDSLGDNGTWTAFVPLPLGANYSGTFNSTSHPLSIAPTILITLTQDSSFNLAGKATIMSSPCISSLNLSGQAIGEAFSLTDAASKAHIIALPNGSGNNGFIFSYTFEPSAASCAGDFGRGSMISNQKDPWGY